MAKRDKNRTPSPFIVRVIGSFEGWRSCTYYDIAGVATIGFGTTGDEARPGRCITKAQGYEYLRRDVMTAARAVNSLVTVPLTQRQFDALVSFVYNVGVGAFADSTLLKKLNRRNYKSVSNQLMRWVIAGGAAVEGLRIRRKREGKIFRSKVRNRRKKGVK